MHKRKLIGTHTQSVIHAIVTDLVYDVFCLSHKYRAEMIN